MAKRRNDTNRDLHKEQAPEGRPDPLAQRTDAPAGWDDVPDDEESETGGGEVPARERQGMTNQPLGEEEEQQRRLPPRGSAKKGTPGGHA